MLYLCDVYLYLCDECDDINIRAFVRFIWTNSFIFIKTIYFWWTSANSVYLQGSE